MNLNSNDDLGFPDWKNPIRFIPELYEKDFLGRPQIGATQKVEENKDEPAAFSFLKQSLKNKLGSEYERKQRKKQLKEKDSKRSLWWLNRDEDGSSIDKIKNWMLMSDIRYGNVKENSKDSKKVEMHQSSRGDDSAFNSLRPLNNLTPQKPLEEDNGIIDPLGTDRRFQTEDQILASESSREEEPNQTVQEPSRKTTG